VAKKKPSKPKAKKKSVPKKMEKDPAYQEARIEHREDDEVIEIEDEVDEVGLESEEKIEDDDGY